MNPGTYCRMVWTHAWRNTAKFTRAQIVFNLLGTLIAAVVTYLISGDIGERFNVKVAVYACIFAAVVIAVLNLIWNLITAPYLLHRELLARLQVFERRPNVDHLVQLHEGGVHLLNQSVQVKERAHHESDEELRAYLAADNQDLLVYQMNLRFWNDDATAELEKCATKSELSLFKIIGSEVPWSEHLGIITVGEFPGVTAVLNHDKAKLAERLELLLAVIRRVERGAA